MTSKVRKRLPPQDAAAVVSPLRDSPSFLVRLVQLAAFDEFHHHFAGLSMTPGRFSVFALIVNNPGIRPGTLSEELRIKPSNVAVIVNALAAERLVERRQDRTELRANTLYPTKSGQKLYQKMWIFTAISTSFCFHRYRFRNGPLLSTCFVSSIEQQTE